MEYKYDLEDITLVPAELSSIKSRSEVSALYSHGKLPLIAAPMDSVINSESAEIFKTHKILTCSIRKEKLDLNQPQYSFISISLQQFQYIVETENSLKNLCWYKQGLLIDIANGHMQELYDLTIQFKKKYPEFSLMIGNVANPKTYEKYCEILSERDMIRLSIGSGSACTTGANTGIYYPMGSLIDECYQISATKSNPPLIVADGGFRNFDDIIKALNIGADYVMLGGIFAKSLEAAGPVYWKGLNVTSIKDVMYMNKYKLYRKYRGMSTKDVQRSIGKTILKTSEGISYQTPVEYTLEKWVDNFCAYLKSAMSYCDCRQLKDFVGKRNFIHISTNAIKRYKK